MVRRIYCGVISGLISLEVFRFEMLVAALLARFCVRYI